jgi:two-component system phosphate regulon response regulator PhoB
MREDPAMAGKVMIIEDEPALTQTLRSNFEAEGFSVVTCADGEEAELLIAEEMPDLVILDCELPDVPGIELCRWVRAGAETKAIPIILLTARVEEADRGRGLSVGADDCVIKPLSVPQLIVRARATLRRVSPSKFAAILNHANIELNRATRQATRNRRKLRMSPAEFRLLEFFMTTPGRVFNRSQLLDGVWGRETSMDERTVDVHIGRLRRAINRGREPDPIRTVRGAGYSFGVRSSN